MTQLEKELITIIIEQSKRITKFNDNLYKLLGVEKIGISVPLDIAGELHHSLFNYLVLQDENEEVIKHSKLYDDIYSGKTRQVLNTFEKIEKMNELKQEELRHENEIGEQERNVQIYTLVEQGQSFAEIAEIYNISESTISQIYTRQERIVNNLKTSELYRYLYENIERNADVTRIYNVLRRRGIDTLEKLNQLLEQDDYVILYKVRYLGQKGLQILRSI